MKTNKSFTKRLKVTKNGKVLARKSGQNHFNAKESRSKQLNQKGFQKFNMTKGATRRFLPRTTSK
jgi:ribosomal protein L35